MSLALIAGWLATPRMAPVFWGTWEGGGGFLCLPLLPCHVWGKAPWEEKLGCFSCWILRLVLAVYDGVGSWNLGSYCTYYGVVVVVVVVSVYVWRSAADRPPS